MKRHALGGVSGLLRAASTNAEADEALEAAKHEEAYALLQVLEWHAREALPGPLLERYADQADMMNRYALVIAKKVIELEKNQSHHYEADDLLGHRDE